MCGQHATTFNVWAQQVYRYLKKKRMHNVQPISQTKFPIVILTDSH